MLARPDPFDPNTLDFGDDREYRLYADDRAQIYAVVDRDDYEFFTRWLWCWKPSRGGHRIKYYLRRAVGENAGGQRLRTFTLYLHIEIMLRSGVLPPSPLHTLVDHRDGESLNCRKKNLRWATHSINQKNKYGRYSGDLADDIPLDRRA